MYYNHSTPSCSRKLILNPCPGHAHLGQPTPMDVEPEPAAGSPFRGFRCTAVAAGYARPTLPTRSHGNARSCAPRVHKLRSSPYTFSVFFWFFSFTLFLSFFVSFFAGIIRHRDGRVPYRNRPVSCQSLDRRPAHGNRIKPIRLRPTRTVSPSTRKRLVFFFFFVFLIPRKNLSNRISKAAPDIRGTIGKTSILLDKHNNWYGL